MIRSTLPESRGTVWDPSRSHVTERNVCGGLMLGGYRRVCCFLALLLTFCAAAYTQQVFGSIFGTVTDPSGSSVVGAKVTVTDINKGTQFEVFTDASGNYNKGQLVRSEERRVGKEWRSR